MNIKHHHFQITWKKLFKEILLNYKLIQKIVNKILNKEIPKQDDDLKKNIRNLLKGYFNTVKIGKKWKK